MRPLLIVVLALSQLGATPDAGRALPADPLGELQASTRRLLEVKIEVKGEASVEAVRRRLGALAALAGAARPLLRGHDVAVRLAAHLALGEAHEAFGKELFAAKAPTAARGEASRAWTDQVATTVERATRTARAHLRSCQELAKAAKVPDGGCGAALGRVGAGEASPAADAAAVARSRMGELQGCFDTWAAEHPQSPAIGLKAHLTLGALGSVEEVELSPRREDQRALYDCVADGLWIWMFPGLADAEIELPIQVAGR